MKNTKRVLENRSASPSMSQAKKVDVEPRYVLDLVEKFNGNNTVFGSVEMSEAEFDRLREGKADGLITARLRQGIKMMTWDSTDLEMAMFKSNALLALLSERFERDIDSTGTDFNVKNPTGGALVVGLQNLIRETQEQLSKAVNEL